MFFFFFSKFISYIVIFSVAFFIVFDTRFFYKKKFYKKMSLKNLKEPQNLKNLKLSSLKHLSWNF